MCIFVVGYIFLLLFKGAMSDKTIYLLQDLEALSNVKVNGIGVFAGDSEGNTLLKKEWWMRVDTSKAVDDTHQEERCMEEFWNKNQAVFVKYILEAKDEDSQIRDYANTIDSLGQIFGVPEKEIKLVADNPEFDWGRLNEPIMRVCNRVPPRYTSKGDYRPITDYSDAVWTLGVGKIVDEGATKVQPHDHFPSNDAEHNYVSHLIHQELLKRIKEEMGDRLGELAKECTDKIVEMVMSKRRPSEGMAEVGTSNP